MSLKANNTALLVFIRDPKLEAGKKVFAEHLGLDGNQKLIKALNQRIIKLCRKTAIPTFIHNGSRQKGETFGVRIANAFESVFNQGFENVIAVGNDCLSISKDILLNAKDKLEQNQMVLGPASDGGVYLIGLSKTAYQRKQFVDLSWTTEQLNQDFLNFAHEFKFSFETFEVASDIDDAYDFKSAIKSLFRLDALLIVIENILSFSQKRIFLFEKKSYKLSYLKCTTLRGPPVLN